VGFGRYLKTAFKNRWNLLALFGSLGFAALSGAPDVLVPLILAGELTYVGLLGANSKFQRYVDAQAAKATREQGTASADQTLQRLMSVLPDNMRQRFETLRRRCLELRQIAMELKDPTLLRRTLELANKRNFECVTTNIWCSDGSLMDHLMYIGNDFMQYVSIFIFPFSTGMYMLFEKKRFMQLGGFNEGALYAEDYLLSKQVKLRRFGILRGRVMTTNRRFKKMGHAKIIWMFFWTVLNSFNKRHFLHDHGYWQTY